jgi:HSP20 family molecular chaperone IbpA
MAILSGNVIGNMKGKLGNLSARTVDGRTIMAARPSSFNASQDPASLEVRAKFAVTANFAKNVLSLATLEEIWAKVKASGMSVFNTVFKNNFGFSSSEKPTEQNILTPEGFPLQITTAAVEADKITASLPALNTASVFGADEVKLSANVLVCYYDPTNEADDPYKIVSLSKEIANFNFTQTYDLEMDFNVLQKAIAAKYLHSILYVCVVTKTAEGKVVQNSGTFTKLS